MRIFLVGVSCVGKTTLGDQLAALRGVPFFDLDAELERFYQRPIGRIQAESGTMDSYRRKASKVLAGLLTSEQSRDCVIALPPSGLMGSYWKTVKAANGVVVVLTDTPENIVERVAFYDQDSRPLNRLLTKDQERTCISEIRKDMAYFRRSYGKANLAVDIAGLRPAEAAAKLNEVLSHRG